MFKELFTTKRICRAGIIAALYVALTWAFGYLSSQGILQIRPGEALCILPLFYVEAIPALTIGCLLGNVISMYGVYDMVFGPLATLIAALLTYFTGRLINEWNANKGKIAARIALGGFFPVIVNAIVVPMIIVLLNGDLCGYETLAIAYGFNFLSMLVSQSLWIYGLGTPLALTVGRMRKKGVAVFLDGKKRPAEATEPPQV